MPAGEAQSMRWRRTSGTNRSALACIPQGRAACALILSELCLAIRGKTLPRLCHVEQHGALLLRAKMTRHRTTLVRMLAVLFDFLHSPFPVAKPEHKRRAAGS
jgi:hypothetical protein